MRLAKLSEYRRLVYTADSAPSLATLRIQIDKGRIAGGQVANGRYYVDLDEFDRATGFHAALVERQRQLASNPLLHGLI